MNLSQSHNGTVTIVHKLDPAQFTIISAFLTGLVSALSGVDEEQLKLLTAKLKASGDALAGTVQQLTPKP